MNLNLELIHFCRNELIHDDLTLNRLLGIGFLILTTRRNRLNDVLLKHLWLLKIDRKI